MAPDLTRLDATAQAELVRQRKATPRELVEAAIARLEKLNPQLGAVIRPRLEKARAEAESATLPDGPFRGVPFLIKDLFCVQAGDELHCGNPALKAAHYTAPVDTYLAARFRAAGLISIGQSNTPEFGFADTTEPEAYGPTRNPWNLEHSTGGSSGGSAAAVAARIVPIAHANDGGGSIRNPASHCGLVGLKPSRGRVSLGPDFAEGWGGLINEGVVSLSVRDTATTLDAISGVMQGDPYSAPKTCSSFADAAQTKPQRLRIGFMKRRPGNEGTVHPDCIAAVEHAAHLLESLGHHVEESYPVALDEDSGNPFDTLFFVAAARTAEETAEKLGREVGPKDFEAYSWYVIELGRKIAAADYLAALDWSGAWSRRVAHWWDSGFDVLLSPTMATPPPRIGHLSSAAAEPEEVMRRSFDMIAFTPAWNMTGQPGLSLPLYWSDDGLPIGVHFVPEYGREDLLLSLAAQLERAQPWIERLPPVHA